MFTIVSPCLKLLLILTLLSISCSPRLTIALPLLHELDRYCAQELVTFDSHPLSNPPEISNDGHHLSAAQFHSVLQNGVADHPFNGIVTSLPNPGGGEFGKFYCLPVMNDPTIVTKADVEKIIGKRHLSIWLRFRLSLPVFFCKQVMPDFTGVPAVVNLACMRDAVNRLGSDSNKINPLPMSMFLPGVVGFKLSGKLRNGVTATDFVLTVTQILRKHGVVGKFV
ncbi:hypothetical protein AgCh_027891 [Apium graveolens]